MRMGGPDNVADFFASDHLEGRLEALEVGDKSSMLSECGRLVGKVCDRPTRKSSLSWSLLGFRFTQRNMCAKLSRGIGGLYFLFCLPFYLDMKNTSDEGRWLS